MNYLHNREVELSGHVIENLNIYEIQKTETCELVKEILLASQINFILHYNDKIICQREKIPVSSRITFQRMYVNLLSSNIT